MRDYLFTGVNIPFYEPKINFEAFYKIRTE